MDNELMDIIEKLDDKYGSSLHWEVLEAKKTESGNWVLTIGRYEKKEANNEDHK